MVKSNTELNTKIDAVADEFGLNDNQITRVKAIFEALNQFTDEEFMAKDIVVHIKTMLSDDKKRQKEMNRRAVKCKNREEKTTAKIQQFRDRQSSIRGGVRVGKETGLAKIMVEKYCSNCDKVTDWRAYNYQNLFCNICGKNE